MNPYCLILCRQQSPDHLQARIKRLYLRAPSPDRAVLTGAEDDPQWRVVGIEHDDVIVRWLQTEPPRPTPEIGHAA